MYCEINDILNKLGFNSEHNYKSDDTIRSLPSFNINCNTNLTVMPNSENRTSRNSLKYAYQIQVNKYLCNCKNKMLCSLVSQCLRETIFYLYKMSTGNHKYYYTGSSTAIWKSRFHYYSHLFQKKK